MKAFNRMIRVFSATTLFFFCWTYMPLFQLAAYAAEKQTLTKVQSSGQGRQTTSNKPDNADRLQKALEEIQKQAGKANEKFGKNQDASSEIVAITAKRAEIESLDTELKKEFAATEKKLKDAHLPKEILDRHYKFVKHYNDNVNQLNSEIADIEKASTKGDKAAARKAFTSLNDHIEKTKPPRKHKPLDPNNLPNRLVKGKAREPRLKKEDFEKDFPKQNRRTVKTAFTSDHSSPSINPFWASAAVPRNSGHGKSLPLLAFNSSITSDMPLQLPLPTRGEGRGEGSILDVAFAMPDDPILLAQATNQPAPDDLAETPEVQFTDDIKGLAAQLNYNPVQIYNWVRNNIEYAPTYGSIQGADQCLQSKICNDMDTASLLIALLRVSGISAHYVYGTIEIPIDKAMNWVGGVTDPKMAGTIFATNGIPGKSLVSGGKIQFVQIEHVWVNAFIDYIPSRGAVQRQGNMWIPLDASFKQYNYTQGMDISSGVPFDVQTFMTQALSTSTTNTIYGSITNLNSAYIQQAGQDYQTQVQNYIQQNYPNATVGDVIGTKQIIQQNYPILAGTLPYKTVQIGSAFSIVPDSLRETMSFTIPDVTGASVGLAYTTGMPQIAGKKITISFSPATSTDEATLEALLPQPSPNGTPIDQSQLPLSLPAYLINFKPELRIAGQVVAAGTPGIMGSDQLFTMSLNEPGIGASNINNVIKTGEYYGIGVDTGRISADRLNALKTKLETTKTKLEARTFDGITKDDLMGDVISTVIACYFAELDAADEIAARTTNIIRYRVPSVGMFSMALNVNDAFGVPTSAAPKGMVMDVDRIMQAAFSKDGNIDKVKQYMLSSGSNSSSLEHDVPRQLFSTPTNQVDGVSAVTALKLANDQGIPVYVIDQSNINSILPLLQLNDDVKADIKNAVNAGKIVTTQQSNISHNGWTGCGYIIIDPITGAGAYMISNGLNGYCFWYYFWTALWILAWIALIISVGILISWFAPEIALACTAISEAVAEIAATIGGIIALLYRQASQVYLNVSTSVSVFIQSGIVRNAIFEAFMFYAQNSPPPLPVPTGALEWTFFYLAYRMFLYFGIQEFIRSGYLNIFWRFATTSRGLGSIVECFKLNLNLELKQPKRDWSPYS